jgi:hypothetical protein
MYTPEENLIIDKAICAFWRQIFFHVYMKAKPHKYGIKIYQLCEAKTGFVCSMDVYACVYQMDGEYSNAFSVLNSLRQSKRYGTRYTRST